MNPFKDLDVEYIWQPYWTFVNPQNGAIDYGYFEQYKNKLVIINFASENWNNFESQVCEQLANTDINFLVLTYDHTKHQQHPRMVYFPYWHEWAHQPEEGWKAWISAKVNNNPKSFLLGCLNGKPRPHRIVNFLKLRKKPYWNNSSVSFYNWPPADVRGDDLPMTDDEIQEWIAIQPTLAKGSQPTKGQGDLNLNLPQLHDSYLHLTTETTVIPGIFTSEKTWKPIAIAVPFVMWGNPGTMAFLKSIGVDTYDDVIDHKYYDTEEDARLRLDKLYKVIDDLINQGVDKIYNQLLDRAVINQTKFFNGEFNQTYQDTTINAINQYK